MNMLKKEKCFYSHTERGPKKDGPFSFDFIL